MSLAALSFDPGQVTIELAERVPTVSVVICTRNRPATLEKCLAAVCGLSPAPDQVLVVDNSEGNSETARLAQRAGARYIVEPVEGLSRARNRGLAECDTEIVAYVDDDAIPAPDWLGFLLTPFENENVAASAGKVFTPESDLEALRNETPRRLNNKSPLWFEIASFGGMGLGSNMALRRSACTGWTVFDERLGRGAPFRIGEETYALAKLLSHGHSAVYLPTAVVMHPSLRRDSTVQEARNSIAYSLVLFFAFPSQRLDLLRFLCRRLRGKPLTWPRDTQEPGDILRSNWKIKVWATLSALILFCRTRKPHDEPRLSDKLPVPQSSTRSAMRRMVVLTAALLSSKRKLSGH